jgi:hypothetical protein
VFALKSYAHFDYSGQMIKANITEGIEVVLTLYYNQLKHGIEVIKHYADVPEILCYPDELNQIWTNLIQNAIQAMEGHGVLEIAVHPSLPPSLPNLSPSLPNRGRRKGGVGGRPDHGFRVWHSRGNQTSDFRAFFHHETCWRRQWPGIKYREKDH